jgi:hypothetical protein
MVRVFSFGEYKSNAFPWRVIDITIKIAPVETQFSIDLHDERPARAFVARRGVAVVAG